MDVRPPSRRSHSRSRSTPWGSEPLKQVWGLKESSSTSERGSFRLTDPECITAALDLMEAISSVPRKRIRIMDVRG